MKYFITIPTILVLLFASAAVSADALDQKLRQYIKAFNFGTPKPTKAKREDLYNLGKALFESPLLSGNKNISCLSCHAPEYASADGLPLALGEGSQERKQTKSTQLISRHTPALFNVSNQMEFFFWDGRVRFHKRFFEYETPSEVLNGEYPEAWEITEVLEGALSAQALFPLLDAKEMMGTNNEISNLKSDQEKWNAIAQRVLNNREFAKLVTSAFPKTDLSSITIAHLANAIAEYETHKFISNKSSWDKYLAGDKAALSRDEKRGLVAFVEKGKCVTCHNGPLFTNHSFQNLAAPQMGEGFDIHKNDEGRFYVTKKREDLYRFKVPSLRNVALTAPYFHSGVYASLEDVIEHYTGGTQSLDQYNPSSIFQKYGAHYLRELFVETGEYRLFRKKEDAHPLIKGKQIRLSSEDKRLILLFLKKSLTDINLNEELL